MKLISWNVNGLRAIMKKDFMKSFYHLNADIFAIQEIKMKEEQKDFFIPGYYEYWNSADKAGYSGTLVYTKVKPLSVIYGIEGRFMDEGRVITLEYERFYFITIYTPNSQHELKRLDYRMQFEDALKEYLLTIKKIKPVIVCGDLNVAHQAIDLAHPKSNINNPGFTIYERNKFTSLLEEGFIDTFRYKYPTVIKYTWWSYIKDARSKNVGWRIDYFLTSTDISQNIVDVVIYNEIMGSDHCPVGLEIKL